MKRIGSILFLMLSSSTVFAQKENVKAELENYFIGKVWIDYALMKGDTIQKSPVGGYNFLKRNGISVDTFRGGHFYGMYLGTVALIADPISGQEKWMYISCRPILLINSKSVDKSYRGIIMSEDISETDVTLNLLNDTVFSYSYLVGKQDIVEYCKIVPAIKEVAEILKN